MLRLLRAVDTDQLAERLALHSEIEVSADVTREAITQLPRLFGSSSAEGVLMAVRAAGGSGPEGTIAGSLSALVDDLWASVAEAH